MGAVHTGVGHAREGAGTNEGGAAGAAAGTECKAAGTEDAGKRICISSSTHRTHVM